MSKHPTQPITSKQFKALSKEEKELYKEVWEFKSYWSEQWQKDTLQWHYENRFNKTFENRLQDLKILNCDGRQMYYPYP